VADREAAPAPEEAKAVPAAGTPGPGGAAASSPKEEPAGADPGPGEKGGPGEKEADGEEYECPMCTFMKGGACKDPFLRWEECVDRARDEGGNMAEKCGQLFMDMNACMVEHADYYAPILALHEEMSEAEEGKGGAEDKAGGAEGA